MSVTVVNFIQSPASGGKFIVMVPCAGGDGGIVALSDFSRDFQHHDIVMRWERTNQTTVSGSGMKVAGGGWWKYEGGDCLVMYGQSAAYGRFDPAWLRPRLQAGMVMNETRLDIR